MVRGNKIACLPTVAWHSSIRCQEPTAWRQESVNVNVWGEVNFVVRLAAENPMPHAILVAALLSSRL